jgi:hypothetical protein
MAKPGKHDHVRLSLERSLTGTMTRMPYNIYAGCRLHITYLQEVPTLNHKVLNDTVEGGILVTLWLLIGGPAEPIQG